MATQGAPSNILSVTTPGVTPGQVTGLVLSALSNNSITATWNAVTTGTGVVVYQVQWKLSAATVWNNAGPPVGSTTGVIVTSGTLSQVITGLLSGRLYNVQVIARNNVGDGTPSATVTAATTGNLDGTLALPGQVTGVTASATVDSNLSVNWAAVATVSPAPAYVVQYRKVGTTTWYTATTTSNLTATITGLIATSAAGSTTPNQYQVQVYAKNSMGAGPASTPVTVAMAFGRNYLIGWRDGNPTDTTTAGLMGQPWDYTINESYEDPWAGAGVSGLDVSTHPGYPVIVAVYHLYTGSATDGSLRYMDPAVAANGGYNTYYKQTADSLIPHAGIIYGVRIDHEFNGTWEPFSPFGGSGQIIDAATWIAGWRNMAQAIRNSLPAAKIIWNPNIGQNDPYPYYPGDDLVDLIGFDAYTQPAFSGNLTSAQMWQEYLNGQGGNNFTALAAFSASHNKPMCFPEWGDGFGDGYYITQFGAWMDQHNVVAHSYWDSADGLTNTTALTQLPANQTAFVNAFGHRPYIGTEWPRKVTPGG